MSAHTVEVSPGYEVTNDGRVFSVESNWRGRGRFELVPDLNSHGYPSVRIYVQGRRKRIGVHVLVARAFLGQRPSPAHEVCHIDGSKTNNSASNLRWGTRSENAADRERHGRTSRGTSHSATIVAAIRNALTRSQRAQISSLGKLRLSQREIARRVRCSQSAVGSHLRGES